MREFTRALLEDVLALEQMIERGMIERGVRRIGAEQEMFLVDRGMQPAPVALDVLERASDPRLVTELARFNLEANLSPLAFGGSCLRDLEAELRLVIGIARSCARDCGAEVLLCGVLPTLEKRHLGLDHMTPSPRYDALNQAMTHMRGGAFHVHIKGTDELEITHDNVMLESCNTSFQLHFQVAPEEFAALYNVAQAVTGPVLAAAVNSPYLLGHRLWSETRIALFQRSVDARSSAHQARGGRPRVGFGDAWVERSVLEIFREDIARFRVLLATEYDERPCTQVAEGRVPRLAALRLHNGTVYRWNRPCFGVTDGVAHLRIENRALPAGPTIIDEIANAALFYGLMVGVSEAIGDPARHMAFDAAKDNFFAAARHGLAAQMTWMGGRARPVRELLLDELLPLAHRGLAHAGIDPDDAERYLAVVRTRTESGRTGAQWTSDSLAAMGKRGTRGQRERSLVAAMLTHQLEDEPVHAWPCATLRGDVDWTHGCRTVGELMSTDLFTVRPDDIVDLATSVMEWEHVRHVPVEDDQGRLVGMVSQRALLGFVAKRGSGTAAAVREVMSPDPIAVTPETSTLEAVRIMRAHGVASLPVVEAGRLVGIVTERDLLAVLERLLGQVFDVS